jgi:hypothetical protein
MKKKLLVFPALIAGLAYCIFNLVAYVGMIKSDNTTLSSGALLFPILSLFGFIVLVAAIILHLFFANKCKYSKALVYLSILIFVTLFFVQDINFWWHNMTTLAEILSDKLQQLDLLDETNRTAAQSIIDTVTADMGGSALRVIADAVLILGSLITFGGLAIKEFYLTRPVKAE